MPWLIPCVRRAATAGDVQPAYYRYVDTPQLSYAQWRDSCGERIGTVPAGTTAKVAIVGAGLAGLAAAYELLACGVDVRLFEAGTRVGGRLYSKKFDQNSPEIAELGAMRFPPSEELLFRFFSKFNIETKADFPDPGQVETEICYKQNVYNIPAKGAPPAEFKTVSDGWNALISDGCTVSYVDSGGKTHVVTLVAPNELRLAMQTDSTGKSLNPSVDPIAAWKDWLTVFNNKSLINGLVTIFNGPNPPGGTAWTYPDDYERFAALGAGFGGFGPLYQVAFLEIIRLVANGLETDQVFVPDGIEQVADSLFTSEITLPNNGGTTTVSDHTQLGVTVVGVYQMGNKIMIFDDKGSPLPGAPFDRVIVATTQRSMEIDSKLGIFSGYHAGSETYGPTLPAEAAQAVNDLHIMNSSKVFIRTKDKFWNDPRKIPNGTRCILSDTLSANLYTLDYGGSYGVVLVSYVWGDESLKQITFKDKRARLAMLQLAIAQYDANFASYLVPLDNDYDTNVQMIDWETEPHYYGAFKLSRPAQDHYVQTAFYHFQSAASATKGQVFLAGDSISWTGGWTEGALQTSMNACCAVIQSLGGTQNNPDNPLTKLVANTFNYDVANG